MARPAAEDYDAAARVADFKGNTALADQYRSTAQQIRDNSAVADTRRDVLGAAFWSAFNHDLNGGTVDFDSIPQQHKRAIRRGIRAVLRVVTQQDISDELAADPAEPVTQPGLGS